MGRAAHTGLGELEPLYRDRFPAFLRVATAITWDEERANDAVQDGFAAAIRERRRFRSVNSSALRRIRSYESASPPCPSVNEPSCSCATSPTSTTGRSATSSGSARERSARR